MPYVLYVNGLNRLPKNVCGPDAGPALSGRLSVGLRAFASIITAMRGLDFITARCLWRLASPSCLRPLTLLPREVNCRLHKQKGIGPRRSLLRHKLDITMSMATVFARRFAAGQVRSHKPGF